MLKTLFFNVLPPKLISFANYAPRATGRIAAGSTFYVKQPPAT